MTRAKKPPGPLRARVHRFLHWVVRLRGSPQAIAGGVAIGTLVAFTPTVGFQGLIALGLATLLGANRSVAVVLTWLTNPVTIPPIYGLTYALGSSFWSGPESQSVAPALAEAAHHLETLDLLDVRDALAVFLALGADVFVAMCIGGLIVGLPTAAILYPLTLRLVMRLRERRARRRARRAASRSRYTDKAAGDRGRPAH